MALQIVDNLLNDLNNSGINYCHWKSNEHLDAAVNGDTDLDVLFDKNQKREIVDILRKNKFYLFEAIWYRKYKGIVDYIGFDQQSGKIVHLHTHFHLDLGEVGIKSYRLPWEELVLKNKIFNSSYNIFTSSPDIEYLLIVVRTAFKYDPIKAKTNFKVAKDYNRESIWLKERVGIKKIKELSNEVLNETMTKTIEAIWEEGSYEETLFKALKKCLKPHFKEYRLLSKERVFYLQFVKSFTNAQVKLRRRIGLRDKFRKRNLPHDGVVISLMGSDGAGKSTQTKELTKELKKKIDVVFMYMGAGAGEKSLQRKIIEKILSKKKNRKASTNLKNKNNQTNKRVKQKRSFLGSLPYNIKVLSLAFERKQKLKLIEKERKRGTIIICDRYPQTYTMGYNDGPKLYEYLKSSNFLLRYIARYEYSCYHLAKSIYPDLVVKLIGKPELLYERRPEMDIEVIRQKQEGIVELPFIEPTKVVVVDIDKPIHRIKGEILDELSKQINHKSKGI